VYHHLLYSVQTQNATANCIDVLVSTRRAGFVIHSEKGGLSTWIDAWFSGSSTNAANVVPGSIFRVLVRLTSTKKPAAYEDRFLLFCDGKI